MHQALEDLAADFAQWRLTRTGNRATPKHLSERVAELLKTIPKADLAKKLKVNYDFLNRLDQPKGHYNHSNPRPISTSHQFVDLEWPVAEDLQNNVAMDPQCTVNHDTLAAHLNFNNGVHLEFNATPGQLAMLIHSLNQKGASK